MPEPLLLTKLYVPPPRPKMVRRPHLVGEVIDRVPALGSRAACTKQYLRDKLVDHKAYIDIHGKDMLEIRNWIWDIKNNETIS